MPFIHIRSLPFEESFDAPRVLKQVSREFSELTGIAIEHITVTWQFLEPEHYAVAGEIAYFQPKDSHPLLIRLLVPSFNSPKNIEFMMEHIANIVSKLTSLPKDNVFIHTELAHSQQVFDSGSIVSWD